MDDKIFVANPNDYADELNRRLFIADPNDCLVELMQYAQRRAIGSGQDCRHLRA